jgi:uncharacterized protein (TIGR03067 family)
MERSIMTTWIRTIAPAFSLAMSLQLAAFADEPKKSDAARLEGAWLFDSAMQGHDSRLGLVWKSKLTVAGDSFALSSFLGLPKELKGKFVFNPGTSPKSVDLKLEEFDLKDAGAPLKIPACTLHGIYELKGGRLTIDFNPEAGGKRPARFGAGADRIQRLAFVKVPTGFKDFPKEVTVRVVGPDGKPSAGATIAGFMSLRENAKDKDARSEWNYFDSVKTGADGIAKFQIEKFPSLQLVVHDPENKRMAIAAVSPSMLAKGQVNVKLESQRSVVGTIVCDELQKAGKPIGWTNVYLIRNGERVADCHSPEGRFEFLAPPGAYTLNAYGSDFKQKYVTVKVAAGTSQFVVDPIHVSATRLVLLQGKPAPELAGVVGWKGKPVKLADLRGKFVLLEFWGYWCGPCVGSMPVLIEMHEKLAAKGLVIVGVHVDGDGEVDTAAKLDEKIAGFRKKLWSGKDLPFPVALVSGKQIGEGENKSRGEAAQVYGVESYPTTVLIDREGKVVGKFHARDAKSAVAEMEKLMDNKK